MERVILHSDVNAFYASVEQMLNPELRNKAIAVCGRTEDRHGIVLAKSEQAKAAGVKTGMINFEALRLCPELIIVPCHYDQYVKYSQLAREIYLRYTDLVEPFGMDECWLDVSKSQSLFGSGLKIAEEIRKTVKEELGCTVSIGVSFNKIFAKLGSDMKKPDAITVLNKNDIEDKVFPLPVSDLLYCGRSTTKKLLKYNIKSIGDLAHSSPAFIKKLLGVNGTALWLYANGKDVSRVKPNDYHIPAKSVGHGITCVTDLKNTHEVWKVMLELCQDVSSKLRDYKLCAGAVQLTIRDNALHYKQYQAPLLLPTQSPTEIARLGLKLLVEKHFWENDIRSVTIRAINLVPEDQPQQINFLIDYKSIKKKKQLDDTVASLRNRFGKRAIQPAVLLGDLKMPGREIHEVTLPNIMFK